MILVSFYDFVDFDGTVCADFYGFDSFVSELVRGLSTMFYET